jgi:hypothetical protein
MTTRRLKLKQSYSLSSLVSSLGLQAKVGDELTNDNELTNDDATAATRRLLRDGRRLTLSSRLSSFVSSRLSSRLALLSSLISRPSQLAATLGNEFSNDGGIGHLLAARRASLLAANFLKMSYEFCHFHSSFVTTTAKQCLVSRAQALGSFRTT